MMLSDITDEFLLTKYPDLPFVALDAGNIKLVEVLLRVGVPDDWTKDNDDMFSLPVDDIQFAYRSAVRCACYWDRPDIYLIYLNV